MLALQQNRSEQDGYLSVKIQYKTCKTSVQPNIELPTTEKFHAEWYFPSCAVQPLNWASLRPTTIDYVVHAPDMKSSLLAPSNKDLCLCDNT